MKGKREPSFSMVQEQLPELMKAFQKFRLEATKEDVLSAEVKELMMIAVSVALRCEPCIRAHTRKAKEMGISRREILEAVGIAIVMTGGPGIAYSSIAMEELGE